MDDKKRIIVALDYDNIDDALSLIDSIDLAYVELKLAKNYFQNMDRL